MACATPFSFSLAQEFSERGPVHKGQLIASYAETTGGVHEDQFVHFQADRDLLHAGNKGRGRPRQPESDKKRIRTEDGPDLSETQIFAVFPGKVDGRRTGGACFERRLL